MMLGSFTTIVIAIIMLVAFSFGINFGMTHGLEGPKHIHNPFSSAASHHHPNHHDVDGNGGKHTSKGPGTVPEVKHDGLNVGGNTVLHVSGALDVGQNRGHGSNPSVATAGATTGGDNRLGEQQGQSSYTSGAAQAGAGAVSRSGGGTVVECTGFTCTDPAVQSVMEEARVTNANVQSVLKETVRVVEANENGAHVKPITRFLDAGGEFPVVLLTCNRPELLDGTLHNLLQVKGVTRDNLLIMQDGNSKGVTQVAEKYGLTPTRNTAGINLRGGVPRDGAARIAAHYKFSLTQAFKAKPDAPAIIIVEDDLLFSPDFYDFFRFNAEVLEQDPSVFLLSAWNDNGFRSKVREPFTIERTEYFPGLGWLLPRELWDRELKEKWPRNHWDHWLRSTEISQGREIMYPQVPRTFHNGIKGTFMDLSTHNRYFRDIAYNRNGRQWGSVAGTRSGAEVQTGVQSHTFATRAVYDARIEQLIQRCKHVDNVEAQLFAEPGVFCLWIDLDPAPPDGTPQQFESIGRFFGLWHEHRRGAHRGVHQFYWFDSYILIMNLWRPRDPEKRKLVKTFGHLKPPQVKVVAPQQFTTPHMSQLKLQKAGIEVTVRIADKVDIDCSTVCEAIDGLMCSEAWFEAINTCETLTAHFPCETCTTSVGREQPAWEKTIDSEQGICLISSSPARTTCSTKHKRTKRLCPCVEAS